MTNFWVDFKRGYPNPPIIGIETDDKDLTFDGRFCCLFPVGSKDDTTDEAMERATKILELIQAGILASKPLLNEPK